MKKIVLLITFTVFLTIWLCMGLIFINTDEYLSIFFFVLSFLSLIGIIITIVVSTTKEEKDRKEHHYNYYAKTLELGSTYQEMKGKIAEYRVGDVLSNLANIYGGKLINSVFIPSGIDRQGNKRSVEIDHILFTKYGIFVIETKSWSATIYGDIDFDEWTLLYSNGTRKTKPNPVRQNDLHVRKLKELFKNTRLPIYSVIVFEDGDISNINIEKVITTGELSDYIASLCQSVRINDFDLNSYYNRIKFYKDHPPVTKEEHIRTIKNNYQA